MNSISGLTRKKVRPPRLGKVARRVRDSRWTAPALLAALLAFYYWRVLIGRDLVSAADLVYALYPPWTSIIPGFAASNTALADSVVSFAPAMSYVRDSLGAGQLPLWNPYTEFGMPFFAQSQWGLLSPAQLPILLLPYRFSVETATTLTGIWKIAIAGGGTFLLARRLRCSRLAACLAAIAYMFGGYTTVWLSMPATSVTAMLPWMCLGVEWVLTGRRVWLGAAGFALTVAAAVLGGHPEVVLFTVMGTAIYAATRLAMEWGAIRGHRVVRIGALAVGSVLALGVCVVMLLPALELYLRSVDHATRQSLYKDTFLPWSQLLRVFDVNRGGSPITGHPELGPRFSAWSAPWYVGVVAVVLIPFAIIRRDKRLIPFALIAVATVIMVMNLWPNRVLSDAFPVLGGVYRVNSLALWSFALAMAAGLGADGFRRFIERHASWSWLGAATGAALCLLLFAELYHWGVNYNPRVPRSRVAVETPKALRATPAGIGAPRTVMLGHGMRAQLPTLFQRTDIRSYGQPTRQDYDEFFKTEIAEYAPWFYATDTAYSIGGLRPNAMRVLEASGVKYAAWADGDWKLSDYTTIRNGVLTVARGPGSGNRAYTVYDYEVIPQRPAALARVADPVFDPLRDVVLEQPPEGVRPSEGTPPQPRVTRYENNHVAVDVNMPRPGILVLSDSTYPGWTASIDGRSTPIIRANGLFRAVAVPAGKHTVTFSFRPTSLMVGASISLLSLLAIGGLALFGRRRRLA